MKNKVGKWLITMLLLSFTASAFATAASPTVATPTTNVLEDENIKVIFGTKVLWDPLGTFVKVVFINKTDKPIQIIWDETQFEDNLGNVVGVIHSGVRYIHAQLHQPPTVIPPNRTIEDVMIPQTHVHFTSSLGWTADSILLNKPTRYAFITYEINGQKHSVYGYIFLRTEKSEKNQKMFFGLDLWTVFGIAELNGKGEITIVRGVNSFIGYQEKRFFAPAKLGQFNTYWTWGTAALR